MDTNLFRPNNTIYQLDRIFADPFKEQKYKAMEAMAQQEKQVLFVKLYNFIFKDPFVYAPSEFVQLVDQIIGHRRLERPWKRDFEQTIRERPMPVC